MMQSLTWACVLSMVAVAGAQPATPAPAKAREKGYPQIRPGDMIKVSGYLGKDILEQAEVVAAWIIKLQSKEAP
jgi:hypothetical protein